MNLQETLTKLDFPSLCELSNEKAITKLFGLNACGIYVLVFTNGEIYVGQSKSARLRLSQHKQKYKDIQQFTFKVTSEDKLTERERYVIKAVEKAGFHLRNILEVEFSHALTNFSQVMTLSEQQVWTTDLQNIDLGVRRIEQPGFRQRQATQYQNFLANPFSQEISYLLQLYVRATIPKSATTEVDFWCVTLQTGIIARINVGWQMTLSVFDNDGSPGYEIYLPRHAVEAILEIDSSEIKGDTGTGWSDKNTGRADYSVFTTNLRAGHRDQLSLQILHTEMFLDFLEDDIFVEAARKFNLTLMQKSLCMWGESHVYDLADRLLMPIP